MNEIKAVSGEEAKKAVLAVHPNAYVYHWGGWRDGERGFNIRQDSGADRVILGSGETPEAAWLDAYSKLPPPPSPEPNAEVRCFKCDHMKFSHDYAGCNALTCGCIRFVAENPIASPAGEGAQPETDIDSSSALNRLANSLAFESSVSLIDSYALQKENGWLYLELENGPDERDALDDSLQYLEQRGLLEKHETHAGWVKVRDENEPQDAIPPATPGENSDECPVCYYDLPAGTKNYTICPKCGCEFGNDDDDKTHEQSRREWIKNGCKLWWNSQSVPAPTIEGAPKHAFEIKIGIGANEEKYVLRALDEIRETIERSGVAGAMSGGWDGSWFIHIAKRDISPDDYRNELEKWRQRWW